MHISARSRLLYSTLTALVVSLTIVAGISGAVPSQQEGKSHVGSITTAGTECITFLIDEPPD